jgi:hypothetical protein
VLVLADVADQPVAALGQPVDRRLDVGVIVLLALAWTPIERRAVKRPNARARRADPGAI